MSGEGNLIGRTTETIRITLNEQLVKDYMLAIDYNGEENLGGLPSTLPFLFWSFFSVPWLKGVKPIIHGNQSFYYKKNLCINETYECYITLTEAYQKKHLQFWNHVLFINQNGEEIAKASTTLIIIGEKEKGSL